MNWSATWECEGMSYQAYNDNRCQIWNEGDGGDERINPDLLISRCEIDKINYYI